MARSEEIRGLDPSKARVGFCRHSAQKLLKDNGITGPPVPVEVLAQKLGIAMSIVALPPRIDGLLTQTGSDLSLDLAEGQSRVRHRFTIAHELGHRVLQHYRQETQVAETEANIFAGALIVPAGWLRKDVKASAFPSIEELARRYDVSTSVLIIAAQGARLLDLLRK
jgi:hypothetical protein